jgi:Rrf2 family nitric oxide-sensitive transcriptional repressor
MRLMKPASSISIGAVVRLMETDFDMVECFNPALNTCRMDAHCVLKGVLGRATRAYLTALDGVTLADLVPQAQVLAPPPAQVLRPVPGLPIAAAH